MDASSRDRLRFTLMDGEVSAWIEQGAIHLVAGDPRHGDPTELTETMARDLARALTRMAERIEAED